MRKIIYSSLIAIAGIYFSSCDDAGVAPSNTYTFTQSGLKHLDQNTQGVYEAWLSFPSPNKDHNEALFKSIGRFNIDATTGQVVNDSGGAMTFKLKNGSLNPSNSEDMLITIEPPSDRLDTIDGDRFIGGIKTGSGNSIAFSCTMNYSDILGNIATQFSTDSTKYILASPTALFPSQQFQKGIWFTLDTNGAAAGLTMLSIADTLDWIYEAWVIDNRDSLNPISLGRFENPNAADHYQQCQAGMGWNKPGNDFILNTGGCPIITNLNSGDYKVMITLEPKHEQGSALSKPFFIRLFYGNLGVSGFGIPSRVTRVVNLPTANISITLVR